MKPAELIALAAKAADYELEDEPASIWVVGASPLDRVLRNKAGGHSVWNPWENDGDAFRLMSRLAIHVNYSFGMGGKAVLADEIEEPLGEDQDAAIRHAIVRAAAEYGAAL